MGRFDLIKEIESEKPEVIAMFATYLASDDAAFINGRTFYVAGGEVSLYSGPIKERTIWKQTMWTMDELVSLVPGILMKNAVSITAPKAEEKK
ncbi:MAG: hypothetical protein L7F78_02700 [Syntrophales bacterium LBB04]|nr:hypothetical protein [Syntrophales bacterium LBB04]